MRVSKLVLALVLAAGMATTAGSCGGALGGFLAWAMMSPHPALFPAGAPARIPSQGALDALSGWLFYSDATPDEILFLAGVGAHATIGTNPLGLLFALGMQVGAVPFSGQYTMTSGGMQNITADMQTDTNASDNPLITLWQFAALGALKIFSACLSGYGPSYDAWFSVRDTMTRRTVRLKLDTNVSCPVGQLGVSGKTG
ncbi:MAG: hypothetical protein ACREJQ_04375, partial [bacterium]